MKKKIIRSERPAKKIILLRFCPKKISWPGPKTQGPPPEYQMDRALALTQLRILHTSTLNPGMGL